MPKQRKPLAPEKFRLIQVARARVNLTELEYSELLRRAEGVTSAWELSEAGFQLVMGVFAEWGFHSDADVRNLGRRPGFATGGQVATIRRLWAEYTGDLGTELELGRWLERSFGVSALRFLRAADAPRVIGALRAMCARRARQAPPAPPSVA